MAKKGTAQRFLDDYEHHIQSAQRHMAKAQEVRREAMVFVQEHGGEEDWSELIDALNRVIQRYKSNPTGAPQYPH